MLLSCSEKIRQEGIVPVIGYGRTSSKNTKDQEESRPAQEKAIRAWAKAHGHKLIRTEWDEGVSGRNGLKEREGLPDALNAIRAGEADGLVVRELDRLSRDLIVQETVLADLWAIRPEVEVYSTRAEEQRNCSRTDDPEEWERKYMRRQLGLVAELVRDLTVARLRRGKRAKAARGGFVGGRPPFGWKAQDKELVEDPEEQVTLARIRELHSEGRSLRTIAFTLDAEGHKPRPGKRRKTETWHPTTLARIVARFEEAS
jgi:DNA invertase Pin-like site-specific DNA recombinase